MKLLLAITIIVDASGHGNFTTVQAAINSLAQDSSAPRHILIKNGVYNEKIFIDKNNIILGGEDKEKTILTFALARDAWRCENPSDWGVATLNLRGSDITLQNLTIQNTYGCDKPGTPYPWYSNNLLIDPQSITLKWVFRGKWDPTTN